MYDIIFELCGTEIIITHQSEKLYAETSTTAIKDTRFNVRSVGCPAIIGNDMYLRGRSTEDDYKPVLYLDDSDEQKLKTFMIGVYTLKSVGYNVGFVFNKVMYGINVGELRCIILDDDSHYDSYGYFLKFLKNALQKAKRTVCKL